MEPSKVSTKLCTMDDLRRADDDDDALAWLSSDAVCEDGAAAAEALALSGCAGDAAAGAADGCAAAGVEEDEACSGCTSAREGILYGDLPLAGLFVIELACDELDACCSCCDGCCCGVGKGTL